MEKAKFKNDMFHIELDVEVKVVDAEQGNNKKIEVKLYKTEEYGRINVNDDGDAITISLRGDAESFTFAHALRFIADSIDPGKISDYVDIDEDYCGNMYYVKKLK